MPRPVKYRRIRFRPAGVTQFRPAGIGRPSEEVVLTLVELEAIRHVDQENLSQSAAAKKMEVSQPTFSRILDSARKKVADALVNGKLIRIEGGRYRMAGRGIGRGRGRFRGGRS